MRRRITGLDLNGRVDVAARDWSPEDDTLRLDPPIVIDGGVAAPVVVAGATDRPRLIAGPQAILAPHGRGEGWGKIGAADRRRSLSAAIDHLGEDPDHAAAVRAAVDALTRGATDIILTVPDLPDFGEAAQGAMLDALRRQRRVRLLWRPVAAFLDLLATGALPLARPGARYRLLVHGAAGLEDQVLTLRDDPEHPGHRAPLREAPGGRVAPTIGLDTLFALASDRVRAANPGLDWRHCEASRLGPGLVTGTAAPAEAEVLRLNNATWIEARAPSLDPADLGLQAVRLPPPDRPVAATFLVTPLAAHLADVLALALGDVRVAPPATIARGAVRAGRLIEAGKPHYFDRLEPISIAVMRGDEPDFEALIEPDAIVPANREYVSPDLDDFVWGRGKTDAEFYVLKGDAEVRHWEVEQPQPPEEDVPVTLRLRQTPGQSWARLSITSRLWAPLERSPIDLDWEALTPLAKTPAEVLDDLRVSPTVPDLLVERSHIDMWRGGPWTGEGARAELARHGSPAPAKVWSQLLISRRREPVTGDRFWLVGSEGDLPRGLSQAHIEALDAAISRSAAAILAASPRRPLTSNVDTQVVTWVYRRCPEAVQDRIVAALRARLAGRPDPLLSPRAASTVVIQGAGRAVTGIPRLAETLGILAALPPNNDTVAAVAMILTRREEAPAALRRDLVDAFAALLGRELQARIASRSFALKFRNVLSAIAGLFRWRVREPYALLAAREPVADRLKATLVRAAELLGEPAYAQVKQVDHKRDQIRKIIEFLDGRGDPDILRLIEQDDDD